MKRIVYFSFIFIFLSLMILLSCQTEKIHEVPTVKTLDVEINYSTDAITAKSGGIVENDGGSVIIARGICWGITDNPDLNDNITDDGSGTGEFTSKLSGLENNTIYYVKAYATNDAGTGFGSVVSFKTKVILSFTDERDGTEYSYVKIGNQFWMQENLAYLPSINTPVSESSTDPFYYVYAYSGTSIENAKATVNFTTYGVLYNWSAAMNGASSSNAVPSGVQGVCPTGWHLPSLAEWDSLIYFLGNTVAGGKMKATGTSESGSGLWDAPNSGATNDSKFSALPAGVRMNEENSGTGDIFWAKGNFTDFWSSYERNSESAWSIELYSTTVNTIEQAWEKNSGFSVRCVKD